MLSQLVILITLASGRAESDVVSQPAQEREQSDQPHVTEPSSQQKQSTVEPIDFAHVDALARFAVDDFVAACVVRPRKVIDHTYIHTLTIWRLLPDGVTFSRIDEMGIQGLALFCGPPPKPRLSDTSVLEWAAVVRTASPPNIVSAAEQWKRSVVPQQLPEFKPIPVQIGGTACFQVPAGTFLNKPRVFGNSTFTDRNGEPADKGINIGNVYDFRSYVEGGTRSSAVFTFSKLDQSHLQDDQLRIELRADVFHTVYRGDAPNVAAIRLRNPTSGLASDRIPFHAKSFVTSTVYVPKTLKSAEGGELRLFNDLVADGELEVILTLQDKTDYLGVGPEDLSIVTPANEYVYVSGNETIITQSEQTLKRMLASEAKPSALEKRITGIKGADIKIVSNVENDSQRVALEQLARLTGDKSATRTWGQALVDATAGFRIDVPETAVITAKFKDRRAVRRAELKLRGVLNAAKNDTRKQIQDALQRHDCRINLHSLGMAMQRIGCPTVSFAQYDEDAGRRTDAIWKLIETALNQIRIENDEETLRISCTHQYVDVNSIDVAHLQFVLATDLFHRERHDLGSDMLARTTKLIPRVPQVWMQPAWEIVYNRSRIFDGLENRYQWVRRGIDLLLDGAEQNPHNIDLIWYTAHVICGKIGSSDERAVFRKLFASDKELHARLAEFIDVRSTKSPVHKVDAILVAHELFKTCIERRSNPTETTTVPPAGFDTVFTSTHFRYAEAMTQEGQWVEAGPHWQAALKGYQEIAAQEKKQETRTDSTAASFSAPDFVGLAIARCEFELNENLPVARRSFYEADQQYDDGKFEKALVTYQKAFRSLGTVLEDRPVLMQQFASDFAPQVTRFRQLQPKPEEPDPSLDVILEYCEGKRPMFNQPNQTEKNE